MSIAAIKASAKSSKSAPAVIAPDDDELDEKQVKAQISGFLANLVQETSQSSKLAYSISHFVEQDLLEIPELHQSFPEARVALKKNKAKTDARSERLKEEIAEFDAEIADFKKTYKQLSRSKKGAKSNIGDLKLTIEGYQEERDDLAEELKGLSGGDAYKPVYPVGTNAPVDNSVRDNDWAILNKWAKKQLKKDNPQLSGIFANLELICDHLGFGKNEKALLRLLVCANENNDFESFVDSISKGKQKATYEVMAKMLGVSRPEMTAMLQLDGPLSEKGMIVTQAGMDDDDFDPDDSAMPFLPDYIMRVLREPDLTVDTISKRLVGEPVTTELDWDRDFAHMGERGDQLIAMLEAAKGGNVKGLNYLLYGLPDTGKTEAVKAAAQKVGLDLYMVGERSNFGGEPNRVDRIQSALLAQALLADKKNAAILFDEMEDLLPSAGGGLFDAPKPDKPVGASKVFLNRLLENNKTITFWTANDPEQFHSAVRRRMRYSIEFDVPPVSVRERLWKSISARHDFNISAEDCKNFAQRYIAPPGMIDTAIRNAVLAGGVKSIPLSLAASADLVFGSRDKIVVRDTVPTNYEPRLLLAKLEQMDFDVSELGNNIRSSGKMKFSMMLYGPPGTGKSAYAAYLARELGMEAMIVKASDILDKYVGGNEQNIANIFKSAREGKKFLIIDEGDTFLRRRDQANQNWEVSTVNEMLTQIESHDYPVALTTNLFADIDPAAKRRFLYKIKCDYMTPEQTNLAFGMFFNKEAPAELTRGPKLTPADFALVKKQMELLPPDIPVERIVRLLAVEANARIEKSSGYDGNPKFGFGTGGTVTALRPV